MTHPEKIQFKIRLKQFALALIGDRIAAAKQAIEQAQQAANQEEKSSAGDKYETARAMGHLQKDMHTRQLGEQIKELSTLHAINIDAIYSSVSAGAFIDCADTAFFIAAGMGKQAIENRTIVFLSPQAPLAKMLLGKKAGDQFPFNHAQRTILEVF
jgi:IS5 family transposase